MFYDASSLYRGHLFIGAPFPFPLLISVFRDYLLSVRFMVTPLYSGGGLLITKWRKLRWWGLEKTANLYQTELTPAESKELSNQALLLGY